MQEQVEECHLSKLPRRFLVGGLKAKRITLATQLIKWYMEHGLEVFNLREIVEFTPRQCFRSFVQCISDARRNRDSDPWKLVLGENSKLIGNSAFGGSLINKDNHRQVTYVKGKENLMREANKSNFVKAIELEDKIFEIHKRYNSVTLNTPMLVGYFILQYAKLRILQFYYDFLYEYVDRKNFALTQMDTDSLYMGIAGNELLDCVKPNLREKFLRSTEAHCHAAVYEANKVNFLPRTCCAKHIAYDKRECGLFKLESSGTSMISLCSKTYSLRTSYGDKVSTKDITKSCLKEPYNNMKRVLEEKAK
jgi:hypothetical protein